MCLGGVKRNPHTSNASKKDVEVALAKWFSGARDRDGRRAQRMKQQHARRSPVPEQHNDKDTDDMENENDM